MRARLLATALAMILLGGAVVANAADTRTAPIRPVKLIEWGGDLYLRGHVFSNEQTTTTATSETTTIDDSSVFEEGIELTSAWYIYHPNLIELHLGVDLAKTQEYVTTSAQDFQTKGDLRGYDFSVLLLQEKPMSIRLFTDKSESLRDRDFAQSVLRETESRGVSIILKKPISILMLLEEVSNSELGDRRNEQEDTTHFRVEVKHRPDSDWITEVFYDFENIDKTTIFSTTAGQTEPAQEFPDRTQEIGFFNSWRFGPEERQHSLTGRGRLYRRGGFFENRVASIDQRLELAHSETLSTFYAASFDLDRIEGQEQRTKTAEIGITKTFYDSLDLTLRGEKYSLAAEKDSEDRYGIFLEADYRKQTAIGQFTSSLMLGWSREEEQSANGRRNVIDERVTLTDANYSSLAQSNAVTSTIQVRDETSTITYVQDVDYLVRTIGIETEIRRLIGSDIDPGQTVLVTYTALTSPQSEFSTHYFDWSNRLALDAIPVTLYMDYRQRRDRLADGEDPGNLDHRRSFLAGAELDYKGLFVTFESECIDQHLSPPSSANRLNVTYRRSLSRNVDLSIGGSLERLTYHQAQRFRLQHGAEVLDSATARLSLTTKIGRNALLRFTSDISQLSGQENRSDFRNSLSFEWQYAKLDFSLEADYNTFTDENLSGTSETTGQDTSVLFRISRKF